MKHMFRLTKKLEKEWEIKPKVGNMCRKPLVDWLKLKALIILYYGINQEAGNLIFLMMT